MKKYNDSRELIESVVVEVSTIVSKMAGIQLGVKQAPMVENRLKSRMIKLQLDSFSEYLDFLKTNKESECQALLSLMTTHHTYFFREFSHFEYLLNKGLNTLVQTAIERGDKKIRIWSAASSRGQEAYSLAMFFNFHLKQMNCGVDFEIWGTDIDPESVKFAKNGVYKVEELKQSPAMYIQDNWIRGKDHVKDFSKVKDHLKSKCHFEVANLLEAQSFLKDKKFDVIFCRNVYIYFTSEQIKLCTQKILNHLTQDGFMFLGISESLNGMKLKIDNVAPSVYRHPQNKINKTESKIVTTKLPVVSDKPINVLCVDDSKAILSLLQNILTKENGFIVKDTASNGLEALEKIKNNKYDVITLDLHMPELDGLGFLESTKTMNRPPVIVVSSINRDDTSIAQKALALGALDYVEKPSLENISQASNEIRAKLKMAISVSGVNKLPNTTKQLANKKAKVLIVDDSKTIRQLLYKIVSEDPNLEVVGEAELPSQVENLIKTLKPDVITMDIQMPEMDGVRLLKRIHPVYRIPTVMISSLSREEGTLVLDALEAGAVDYIQKPDFKDLTEASKLIREKIKAAAQVSLKKRSRRSQSVVNYSKLDKNSLVLIGASTGGTEAIKEILQAFPSEIPPILIVQHIPPVFSAAFANRLNSICRFEVREASDGDEVKPNQVLIAPGGKQMGVRLVKEKLIVNINDEAPLNRHKPSVDYLFNSVAEANLKNVVSVILTGMGADGAKGMKRLKDRGSKTIAQNKETCVVYGMPREAVEIGAVDFTLPLEEIPYKIINLSVEVKVKKAS